MPATLSDLMRDDLLRSLLRHACGHSMFCPTCGTVLDCRRAVIVDVDVPSSAGTFTCCADCWDKRTPRDGVILHADGRTLWADPVDAVNVPPLKTSTGLLATQGRCRKCNVRHVWPKSQGSLKGASCPTCHRPLKRTSRDAWCPTVEHASRPTGRTSIPGAPAP